jgi:hypothetical protein
VGLGGILQRLKTEGVLALYHDYRSGTLLDLSGNGHNGVGTDIAFIKNGIMQTSANSLIAVTSSALLEGTSGCLLFRVKKTSPTTTWIMTKKSGANYQFRVTVDNTQISFRDSSASPYPDITTPTDGVRTLGINFATGGIPTGWKDGLYLGVFDDTATITPNNGNLEIGNDGSGVGVIGTLYYYFVWVTRVLTAAEHQEIYQQLQALS